MTKQSLPVSNNFCPQTLFLYGTYRDDGTPNFGLFCWFSYCWDGGLGAMACIGGEKLTKDRIRATGVFSANLVTEGMLPLANYLGSKPGYDPDKMKIAVSTSRGQVLNVPILTASPWSFELEVRHTLPLDGSDVFLCDIRNVLADSALADDSRTIAERLADIAPVRTTCTTYFSHSGEALGGWGEPQAAVTLPHS